MKKERVKRILKGTCMIIAGVSVSATVGLALKNVIPMDNLTKLSKGMIILGAGILGGMASDAGSAYVGEIVDAIFPDPQETISQ